MNELERLLLALPPPEASCQLDQRVQTLLADSVPPRFHNRRWAVALLSLVAICAGPIGFWWGRQSVSGSQPPSVAVPAPVPTANPHNFVQVSLHKDQLAALFVNSSPPEPMLGRGPVQLHISTSTRK